MKCVICKSGDAAPGTTTVVLERGRCAIVFREVPATLCQNCGEAYVGDDVASRLLSRAEQAVANGTELEIVRYAA
ncbi:type II toxin-antitoxin system MqsA family antitoxin [Candidatus Sumerlaeota bacterium]|nr:type II toxin-antitoxin system MqsA family antitoxin [Candidatus Sumerlaeota bacterium]